MECVTYDACLSKGEVLNLENAWRERVHFCKALRKRNVMFILFQTVLTADVVRLILSMEEQVIFYVQEMRTTEECDEVVTYKMLEGVQTVK